MTEQQQTIRDFLTAARMHTNDTFCKRYGHPFLLGREVLEEEFAFSTAIASTDEPGLTERRRGLRIRDWVLAVHSPEVGVTSHRVFVGRSSNNAISIPHPTVSKLHAYFVLEEEHWWIVDVGSSNGTRVNGMRAPSRAKTELHDRDVVVFGRCAFSFLSPPSLFELVQRMASVIDERVEGESA